jgi:hypothetical protein
MMSDPVETDASLGYLRKLARMFGGRIVVIGGWAVHLLADARYREVTGNEYLRSRDIDLIISAGGAFVTRFHSSIRTLGFVEGGLPFRYQLILDRDTGAPIDEKKAAGMNTHDLVYIFLDVFSSKKIGMGSWIIPDLARALRGRRMMGGIPVAPPGEVLKMKLLSFGERENSEKREKDACDIYALLHYCGLGRKQLPGNPALRAIADNYSEHIAETLFRDRNLGGIVRRNLESRLVDGRARRPRQ